MVSGVAMGSIEVIEEHYGTPLSCSLTTRKEGATSRLKCASALLANDTRLKLPTLLLFCSCQL
jgi:hypothetical protein